MVVRPVRAADFQAVCGLLAELGRPAVGSRTEDVCRATFEADLADPSADHLLALDDGDTPVGFCSLHYRRRLNQPVEEAWIPDLIVADRVRGTGVGRALLVEAERRAIDRGCHHITLESGHARTRAHGVYVAAGFQDTGRQFGKRLS